LESLESRRKNCQEIFSFSGKKPHERVKGECDEIRRYVFKTKSPIFLKKRKIGDVLQTRNSA